MKRFLAGLLFALLASPAFSQGLPVCNWGDILYRSSIGYACVPYDPTPGKFLQGNGASAAPIWTFQAPSSFLLPTQSTNTFLGNTTGGNASPTPNTVSQILDTIGYDIARPPTPGSILYKSAVSPNNAWQALQPAPSGYALTSGGAANPPSWALNFGFVTPGIAGTCLTSNGVSVTPSWQTCSGGGGGNSIVINTTAITGGTTLGLLYDNGGTVGNLSTQANSILATDAGGSPSVTSTLPLAVQSAINQVGTLTSGVTGAGFSLNLTLATKIGVLPLANGGTGTTSISSALDTAFSSAQGSILYRDFSGWQALAPGTTGQVLSTSGAAANPAWLTVTGAGTVTSVGTGTGLTGGPITAGGTISLAPIASSTLLANVTGGNAAPIANTPSAVLDTIGATRGVILYRGASGWAALGTGTTGQLLKANGAGADPSWATVASSGTVTSATIVGGTGITAAGTCTITTTGTCTVTNNGVVSIATNAGNFTLNASKGLTNATNDIQTTFTQIGTGAQPTDIPAWMKKRTVTPWDFTSATIDDGTTSAQAAIQLALNTGKDVYLPKPATCYRVDTDLVMPVVAGQQIYGDGFDTIICPKLNNFTHGLFVCSGGQPGNTFRDMKVSYLLQTDPVPAASTTGSISGTALTVANGTGIAIGQSIGITGVVANGTVITAGSGTSWTVNISQSVSSTPMIFYTVAALRAQLTQYKPVFYCQNSPRVTVRNMQVAAAWDGGDFTGNAGGLVVDNLQMSAFNTGLQFNNALDTIRISKFHFWPFDLTANQQILMYASPTLAILTGRVDGLLIDEFLNFAWRAINITDICNCQIDNSYLDSFNGILQSGGTLTVSNTTLTLGGDRTGNVYIGTGTSTPPVRALFSGVRVLGGSTFSPFQLQSSSGAQLIINGCVGDIIAGSGSFVSVASSAVATDLQVSTCNVNMNTNNTTSFVLAQTPSSGVNNIHVTNNIIKTTAATTYSSPLIDVASGNRLTAVGNRTDDSSTSSVFIRKSGAANYDYVTGNAGPGWTYSLPVTGPPGYYFNNQ